MNLLFLYGPPGVGKLTVAKALAIATGYPLVHNHLTIDLASKLFGVRTKEFADLTLSLRLRVLEAAIEADLPAMIVTFAYGVETHEVCDDWAVRPMADLVEASGGRTHFVRLTCDRAELRRRVTDPSRAGFRKVRDPATLDRLLQEHDVDGSVGFAASLVLDNTELLPEACAAQIQAHLADAL